MKVAILYHDIGRLSQATWSNTFDDIIYKEKNKPFTKILKWFYDFTGNFGVAIILFTILIRALLFPIAQKSFKSMEKMKRRNVLWQVRQR